MKKGRNEAEEILNTRMFVRDLKRLKTLGIIRKEAVLINTSLVKSGRTDVYEELPAEAESSVDEFVKYLQKAYGMNKYDMMKELQNMKQGQNESPHTFLSRVITFFYEAKGKQKKKVADIAADADETFEIAGIFLRGLYDQRVRIALKQRVDELNITTLADITKNIQSSYKDTTISSVQMVKEDMKENEDIEENKVTPESEVNGMTREIGILQINNSRYNRNFRQSQDYRGNKIAKNWTRQTEGNYKPYGRIEQRCYKCNHLVHYARDCESVVPRSNMKCFNCGGSFQKKQ